ncbi:hypothetical protein [Rhodococcoides fascians]|uniref:hypothetical protein n=1 Tax=Rhodococcoides fascians TaxID=1828 RepID=UPI00050BDAFC|nr:hypothetical protein [Rhodococcus fascians]
MTEQGIGTAFLYAAVIAFFVSLAFAAWKGPKRSKTKPAGPSSFDLFRDVYMRIDRIGDNTIGRSTPSNFSAWTDCPKCGEIALHGLREPSVEPLLLGFTDERAFSVIRTCKCGNEWGEL